MEIQCPQRHFALFNMFPIPIDCRDNSASMNNFCISQHVNGGDLLNSSYIIVLIGEYSFCSLRRQPTLNAISDGSHAAGGD